MSATDCAREDTRRRGQVQGRRNARSRPDVRLCDAASRPVVGRAAAACRATRALAIEPGLVLLDEPFSALDKNLRLDMQIEIKSLLKSFGVTSIIVTHDQEEALSMADRIVVLNKGASAGRQSRRALRRPQACSSTASSGMPTFCAQPCWTAIESSSTPGRNSSWPSPLSAGAAPP
jgi:hypothetical protein